MISRQSFFHAVGRFFPTFFISFLLGGVWGFTAVTSLGIVAFVTHLGELGWDLWSGAMLVLALNFVQRIAGSTFDNGVAAETKSRRTDKIISVVSFAIAYVVAWVSLHDLAILL